MAGCVCVSLCGCVCVCVSVSLMCVFVCISIWQGEEALNCHAEQSVSFMKQVVTLSELNEEEG